MEPKSLAQDLADDSGYASRKYHALYVAWLMLLVGFGASAYWPAASALFPTFCTFLGTSLALYYGANSAHSWIASKTETAQSEPKR